MPEFGLTSYQRKLHSNQAKRWRHLWKGLHGKDFIGEVTGRRRCSECMRISGFKHGITRPGLIRRYMKEFEIYGTKCLLNEYILLQGDVDALKSRPERKTPSSMETPDRFSLLTKTPKEIFASGKKEPLWKVKAPPPNGNSCGKNEDTDNKYCEFHSDTGHNTDECMQLRKQIDEMIKAGKLSQFIKELKQNDKT
ncbi:hypothetical protein Tco_0064072 [Tanacetum coccineum]